MLYLKTQAGPGKWDLYPADNVRWDNTYYSVDLERDPESDMVPGLDYREYFRTKGVHESSVPNLICCTPYLNSPETFGHFDDCVRWALREFGSTSYFHVFQGDAYILGENGATIDKI